MSPHNGCNPPYDHTKVWNNTNAWCGKIPLLDFNVAVKGVDFNNKTTSGLGGTAYRQLTADVVAKLSQALPIKSSWVTGGTYSDEHAAVCACRLFTATMAYINALNDIPNTGQPLQQGKRPQGAGDELVVDGLEEEEVPDPVVTADILKSFRMMEYVAGSEEPVLNPPA